MINRGISKARDIAYILGLSYDDSVEAAMVQKAIRNLKNNLNFVDGGSHDIRILKQGNDYLRTGVCNKTFSRDFKISYVPNHLSFTTLDECIASNFKVKKDKIPHSPLSLKEVRNIAESQASYIQDSSSGLILQHLSVIERAEAIYPVHVCFLQSIKDNSIRTLIYDEKIGDFVLGLSPLFNESGFIEELLPKCIKKEVVSENLIQVESGEKEKDQIIAEQKLIEIEENPQEQEEIENCNLIIGSSYNTPEFESQLQNIFDSHRNQEIWLISPWIKKYAFLTAREPMIRKFLDKGGAIFIGYSEPEREDEDMVDSISMNVLKRLDKNYDRFYFAELPKFHIKNVIEYRNNNTILYSGSFNVLSFYINDNIKHYRQEEMTVVNPRTAEEKRQKFLELFSEKYVIELTNKVANSQIGDSISIDKLDYLNSLGVVSDAIARIEEKAKSGSINIVNTKNQSVEDYLTLSEKILNTTGDTTDQYYVLSILSACLYQYSYYNDKKDEQNADLAINHLCKKLLGRNSYYLGNTCRFALWPGKIDNKKSKLCIVCNDFNFEFEEISLPKLIFKSIYSKKEKIYFKEENIKRVYPSTNERILTSSAKSLEIL